MSERISLYKEGSKFFNESQDDKSIGKFENIEYARNGKLLESYNRILLESNETEIGRGNNAIVFRTLDEETERPVCVKAVWGAGKIQADIKDGRRDLLPPLGKVFSRFQDHFRRVRDKKKKLAAGGVIGFRDQNKPQEEAEITNEAHLILKRSSSEVTTPWISRIIEIEREESEWGAGIDYPYSYSEKASLLVMDQIDGVSIEDMILSRDRFSEIRDKINFSEFVRKLEDAIKILHDAGLSHQDISTRNIMIDKDGNPVIIDFGATKRIGANFMETTKTDFEDLRQTMDWLRRYLDNPTGTAEKLEELYEKAE